MIAFNFDYSASVRLILDFDCFTMSHILQVNINDLFKAIAIHEVSQNYCKKIISQFF